MIGFDPQHVGIGMRVPALPVGHIPIGFTDFATDQKAWMQINLITVSKRDQEVEGTKGFRIVVTRTRLDPCPNKVETNRIDSQFVQDRKSTRLNSSHVA